MAQIASADTYLNHPDDGNMSVGTMSDKHRDILKKCHADLIKDLDMRTLIPYLYSEDILEEFEHDRLVDMGNKQDTAVEFLRYFKTRGNESYYKFCDILKENNQPWLYDMLMDEEDKKAWRKLSEKSEEAESINLKDAIRSHNETLIKDISESGIIDVRDPADTVAIGGEQTVPKDQFGELETDGLDEGIEGTMKLVETMNPVETKLITLKEPANQSNLLTAEKIRELDCVKEMRKYQYELAEAGVAGKNTMIVAPTGSGKTRVATYIIAHHIAKKGLKSHVIFFCQNVALVKQQYEKLSENFKTKVNVDMIVGKNEDDGPRIDVMLKRNQIVVMTPALFLDAMELKIANIFYPTLIVFDECHHTNGNHLFNQIMKIYIDFKMAFNELEKNEHKKKLPQIVGMTASPGVGKARVELEAKKYILRLCANLDVEQISVVKENVEELEEYNKGPKLESLQISTKEPDDFENIIVSIVQQIEDCIKNIPSNPFLDFSKLQFPKGYVEEYQNFLSGVSDMTGNIENNEDRKKVRICLEYLRIFHHALLLHHEVRATDSFELLMKEFDRIQQKPKDLDDTERWITNLYKKNWAELKKLMVDPKCENEALKDLKQYLLKAYEKDEEKKEEILGILFVKRRETAGALVEWINEDPNLQFLNPTYLTGIGSEAKGAMSMKQQKDVLQYFKWGDCKLLISTSAGEEGLDISACNLVMRYNYATSEVGEVQTRGRARKEGGRVVIVTTRDNQKLQKKVKVNLFRESIMRDAVAKITRMKEEVYENTIDACQKIARNKWICEEEMNRRKQACKSEQVFDVHCYICNTFVCKSTDIMVLPFDKNSHTCMNPDFMKKIKVQKAEAGRAGKKRAHMTIEYTMHCNAEKCGEKWGSLSYYEGFQYPMMGVKRFAFSINGIYSTGKRHKKWIETPVKHYETVDEEIFKNHFKDIDFDLSF